MAGEKIHEIVPHGLYCYGADSRGVRFRCPYWSYRGPHNGYCAHLNKDDNQLEGGLLWDQVKECGINMDFKE